jgi:UDP-N-acetyl-2-amino-2-deoxyglucuronate dehydrogenase
LDIWGLKSQIIYINTHNRVGGIMELERARFRWFLSINEEFLPKEVLFVGKRTYSSNMI